MYICTYKGDNDNKMKIWLQKTRLMAQWTSRLTTIRLVGPSLWCGAVARHETLNTRYSVLAPDCPWWGNVLIGLLNIDRWETRTCTILDWIHAKVGDRNLYILGGLFTIEIDGDDRLVSQDVCGWWVAGAISGRATKITTWRGDLVLCWFDSQVSGLFLFHLVTWWFWD